jgi:50S ribosomal protein L16 3-hydroxylase
MTQSPTQSLALLGGLSPEQFMRRHWQKKPLLVRQAWAQTSPLLSPAALMALAGQEGVESRLIRQGAQGWSLQHGPFTRRQLPALSQKQWTLLVQGVDLHCPAAHELLMKFRFVPDARLDDVMVSYATDGGGVGPHFDSYDVFLLQLQGSRRWRIGRLRDPQLQADMPLKILSNFEPEQEWVLQAGDMLYLPPRWAHDGVAQGPCMTCSIGFRAASSQEFAREVLQRSLDALEDEAPNAKLYRDPQQEATQTPALIPLPLQAFAQQAVSRMLQDSAFLNCGLGEWLSEPKPGVWFEEARAAVSKRVALRLDARSRMLYDDKHLFINGESFRAAGPDARLLRRLADARCLSLQDTQKLSNQAWVLVQDWLAFGWLWPQGEHP